MSNERIPLPADPLTIAAPPVKRRRVPTMLLLALWPARAMPRIRSSSLAKAFGMHTFCWIAGLFAVSLCIALDSAGSRSYIATLNALFRDFARLVVNQWPESALYLLIGVAFVEFWYVLLVFVLIPIGACDEPVRSSVRNSIVRVCWSSPFLVTGILVAGLGINLLNYAAQEWRTANTGRFYERPPVPPAAPLFGPAAAAVAAKYQADLAQFHQRQLLVQQEWSAIWRRSPFYVRHNDELIAVITCLAGLTIVIGLQCAVAAPRNTPQIRRPPMCEDCGYNLTGLSSTSLCPECGHPAAISLDALRRDGGPWPHRRTCGSVSAFWRTSDYALRAPTRLGKQLDPLAVNKDHLSFLWWNLPFFGLAGVFWVWGEALVSMSHSPRGLLRDGLLFDSMTAMPASALIGTAISFTAANVVGLWLRLRCGRNILYGAAQMACFASPVLWMSGILSALLFVILFKLHAEGLGLLVFPDRYGSEWLAAGVWFLGTAILTVLYFSTISRGAAAMRFANSPSNLLPPDGNPPTATQSCQSPQSPVQQNPI